MIKKEQEKERETEKEATSTATPLSPTPLVARTMDFDTLAAPCTATVIPLARLETPTTEATFSQAATSTSSPSIVPEPLNSWLSEEEFEALKA